MNQLQVFKHEEFGQVRSILIDGEPWFVAKDVCDCLEIQNPSDALQRLDADERARFNLGRQGESNIVNEPGLYSLILGSRKPEAKAFKRWITHEVIPSIRKTGSYSINNDRELTQEDWMKIAEFISKTPKDRFTYLLIVLNKIAPGEFVQDEKNIIILNEDIDHRTDSMYQFLKSTPVINFPTNEIYRKYCDYCSTNNIEALSNITFSKQAKNLLNIDIISKRIDGQVRRVFTTK